MSIRHSLKSFLRPFLLALQFLTRLPVPLDDAPTEEEIGQSVLYYPVVGLLIGGAFALLGGLLGGQAIFWQAIFAPSWMASVFAGFPVFAGFLIPSFPPLLSAALILAVWMLVTGGLHLDGLADSADAWVGGQGDPERTLAIMKDPRCGPMAVITLIAVLLLKFSALASLLENGHVSLIVFAPLFGRAALPLLFLSTSYVRPGGLGLAMSRALPRKMSVVVLLTVCAGTIAWHGRLGAVLIAAASVVFWLLRRAMLMRLKGTTGDTAGALVELMETALLLVAAAYSASAVS